MSFTRQELAEHWHIGVRTLERYTRNGLIHAMKVSPARNGRVIYTDHEVRRVEDNWAALGLSHPLPR